MQGDEGQYVESTDPGVYASVSAQIDVVPSEAGEIHSRRFHSRGRTDERDDGPVVVWIGGPVQHLHVVGVDPFDEIANQAEVPTFRDVRDRL